MGGPSWLRLELNTPGKRSGLKGAKGARIGRIEERPPSVNYALTRSFLGSERNFPFISKMLGQSFAGRD